MKERHEFPGTARFRILRRIGAGGMGVVYQAHDLERDTRVALKTLRTLEADALLRFKTEFRDFQHLDHPNLVSLGELIFEAGVWFFTMEFIEGVDFFDHVRPTDTPVEIGRLRAAVIQLARALTALHDARKVHRDVKPSNILVTPAGRTVLLDFGLAQDVGSGRSLTGEHQVMGTVEYMAPEQSLSQPLGPPADWYAVGVLLYEALTGRLPFDGTGLQILLDKQSREPVAPRTFARDIPEDLDALCMDLLRLDPALRPAGRDVLERLGGRDSASQRIALGPAVTSSPFVGRGRELGLLHAAAAQAGRGHPVAMVVSGESGVGKTQLVRQFAERWIADRPGGVVLAGRCFERESVPYKAFDGVVDALSRFLLSLPIDQSAAVLPRHVGLLGQVFPVLRRVEAVAQAPLTTSTVIDRREQRARVFAALRELLQRLAARRPVLLTIDDLQWADADSLALLGEILLPPEAPPVLLLCTARAEASLDLPAYLTPHVRHVRLESLPHADAITLVEALAARLPWAGRPDADAIAAEAGGHPLFIDALVRHAAAEGGGPALKLEDALWSRALRLEGPARQILELTCVAGAPLTQDVVGRAAALELAQAARAFAQLRTANLVRTTGARGADSVEAYHDRVRVAVTGHLDGTRIRACHERLAIALEATGRAADPEALSYHWRGAGEPARALRYASQAAREAAEALAFDRAARLYRLTLSLFGGNATPASFALKLKLAEALANGGRGADAAEAYFAAAQGAAPPEALDLQRRAAEQLLMSGHVDKGLAAVRTVLATIGLSMPATPGAALRGFLRSRLRLWWRGLAFKPERAAQASPALYTQSDVCWGLAAGLGMVDPILSADFMTRSLITALDIGEPARISRSLSLEATLISVRGGHRRYARAQAVLTQAKALAESAHDPHAIAFAELAAGDVAFLYGHWKDALARLTLAESLLRERCTGVAWELASAQTFRMGALYSMGQLAEICRSLPAMLKEAEQRGDLYALTNLVVGTGYVAHLVRDEIGRARQEPAEAMKRWSHRGYHVQHWMHMFGQAHVDLYADPGVAAHRRIEERWQPYAASQLQRIQQTRIASQYVRVRGFLAAAIEDKAGRETHLAGAERIARLLAREESHWTAPIVLQIRATVAWLRSQTDEAARLCGEAAAAYDACDMTLSGTILRRCRGKVVGGDEGHRLVNLGDAALAREGVVSPARMYAVFAPGFDL